MITIREFTNQIEAALIQSLLKDNEIDSILADENARAWAGAPNLVPIRLQGEIGVRVHFLSWFSYRLCVRDRHEGRVSGSESVKEHGGHRC
jgi:hypothetical protein